MRRSATMLVPLLLAMGCPREKPDDSKAPLEETGDTGDSCHETCDSEPAPADGDDDGYPEGDDCDDGNAQVHPGAIEICDGIDNDCDGAVDDEDVDLDLMTATTWYADSDRDGFGSVNEAQQACTQPEGTVDDATDCDDADASVHPEATDDCDGVDSDCDGTVDDECAAGPSGEMELAATSEARFLGPEGSLAGWSLAGAGDVNADGFDDVLVGAYREGTNGEEAGAAYLVHGPVSGDVDLTSTYEARVLGPDEDAWLGYSVAGAGDVNADGYADILVSYQPYGVTCLYQGPITGDYQTTDADARIGELAPEWPYNGVWIVGKAGDTNGDGFDDLMLADSGYSDESNYGAGIVYLIHGPVSGDHETLDVANATLVGEDYYGAAGNSIASAGDTDGDGRDDVLVGSANDGWLIPGDASGTRTISDAGWTISIEDGNCGLVAAAGDVNADGHADILIGNGQDSTNGDNAGAVYLVLGPITADANLASAHATLLGEATSDYAYVGSGAGDTNSDGNDDLLVGAALEDSAGEAAGAVYLVYGPTSGTTILSSADAKLTGESSDSAGIALDAAGDTNADSYADFLVGAHTNDVNGEAAGAVYLVIGGP